MDSPNLRRVRFSVEFYLHPSAVDFARLEDVLTHLVVDRLPQFDGDNVAAFEAQGSLEDITEEHRRRLTFLAYRDAAVAKIEEYWVSMGEYPSVIAMHIEDEANRLDRAHAEDPHLEWFPSDLDDLPE